MIPGVGITRCGYIEWKDLDTAQEEKRFSVSKFLPLTFGSKRIKERRVLETFL